MTDQFDTAALDYRRLIDKFDSLQEERGEKRFCFLLFLLPESNISPGEVGRTGEKKRAVSNLILSHLYPVSVLGTFAGSKQHLGRTKWKDQRSTELQMRHHHRRAAQEKHHRRQIKLDEGDCGVLE